jgi:hypothetical protein
MHLKKKLNITFSPKLTRLLHHLQVLELHHLQLLVQDPRMLLSQINPTALKLLAVMGSRAGSLLLWENESLKVTSMASISLALLFPFRLLGFVTAWAQICLIFRPLASFHSQFDTCDRSVICLVNKYPNFLGFIFSPTPPSLLYHSIILSSVLLVFYST